MILDRSYLPFSKNESRVGCDSLVHLISVYLSGITDISIIQ